MRNQCVAHRSALRDRFTKVGIRRAERPAASNIASVNDQSRSGKTAIGLVVPLYEIIIADL
jgi:hypothetical protein